MRRAPRTSTSEAAISVIPGLDKFAAEYVSAKAIGDDGYLARAS